MPSSNILWNPSRVLFIYPMEPEFHCLGWARTTSDGCCHCPIARPNRNAASRILDTLSLLEPGSSASTAVLQQLAPIILCQRFHQSQADNLLHELEKRMRLVSATSNEAQRPSLRATEWRPRRLIKSRGWHDPLPNAQPGSQPPSRRQTASAAPSSISSTVTTTRIPTSTSSSNANSVGAESLAALIALLSNSSSGSADSAVSGGQSAGVSVGTPPSTSNTSTSASTNSATSQQQRTRRQQHTGCNAQHVRRRPHDTDDCRICYEPMAAGERLVWCKAECGQNFHRECFKPWEREARSNGRTVRCCNCRAAWQAPCEHDETCATPHVRRRAYETEECRICFERMTPEERLVWCKAQCGQSFHQECFGLWEQQLRSDGAALRCCNCRIAWQAPCEHDEVQPPAHDS